MNKISRILANVSFSIILIAGLSGCGGQDSKYEKAKRQAEGSVTKLEEILKPIKAIEQDGLSALPTDLDSLEHLSKNADIQKINKLGNEVSKAMQKVFELKPENRNDDYERWNQKMKQRLELLN